MFCIVVIDDEAKVVKTICNFINENLLNVKIVGTANNILDGAKIIRKENPDLVLLDIEMPHGNGFDLLEKFPMRNFDVIFITAYNQYAIKAFRVNAVDYILKPIDETDLIRSIKEIIEKQNTYKGDDTINHLLESIKNDRVKKLLIHTKSGVEYIDVDSIIKVSADGNYSNIYLKGNRHICSSKKIKNIDAVLPSNMFFRTHKSYIVNIEKVVRYSNSNQTVIMNDNSEVSLARNKKEAFLDVMEKTFVV